MVASSEVLSGNDVQSGGERDQQMAAIRQVLADLIVDDDDVDAKAEVEERPASRAPMRKRDDELEDEDAARSWADNAFNSASTKVQSAPRRCDIVGLRRSHDKRVKALLRSEARRKKSGAFLTGFTLVSVIAAAMVGLYVLHPQIIAASPEMAPAMNEYVGTVDRYRVETNERTAEWSGWLAERIGKIAERVE